MRKLLAALLFTLPLFAQVGDIRGSGYYQTAGGSVPRTVTISWPSGTVAGDLGIIMVGLNPGGTVTGPTGWSSLTTFGRNTFNGYSYSKTLNSTDITAGSTTWATTNDNATYIGIVTFIGSFTIRSTASSVSGGSPATVNATASVNDLALFFCVAVFPPSTSFSLGANLQPGSGGYPSMYAYGVVTAGTNGNTASWTGGSTNSGTLEILIENAGSRGSSVANPSVFGIAVQ